MPKYKITYLDRDSGKVGTVKAKGKTMSQAVSNSLDNIPGYNFIIFKATMTKKSAQREVGTYR